MMEMKNGKLLVEPLKEATSSIIAAPEIAEKRPQRGLVKAVGEGVLKPNGTREAMDVMVGEVVVFTFYNATELKIDGKVYLVVDYKDVLGVEEAA